MKDLAYERMDQLASSHWWYRGRSAIILSILERFVPKGAKLLDFGAGTGFMATTLKEAGYQVVAIDQSAIALQACQQRGLETLDVNCHPLPSCHAILAADVLEHLPNESPTLQQLKEAIQPSGLLIVTVPAYEFLWSGEDYISNHYRRYTRSSLQHILQKEGFNVLWCSYFNFFLLIPITMAILAIRLFFPKKLYQSNVEEVTPSINRLLYRIFSSESHWLRWMRFPVGASIIAVAKKQ